MRVLILILTLSSLLFSCNEDNHPETNETEQLLSDAGFSVSDSVYLGMYIRYSGKIGNQDVVLNLVQYKENIHAEYYYTRIGRNISLYQVNDSNISEDAISFVEYAPDIDESSGKWQVRIYADTIIGKWYNEELKRSYDIFLTKDMNMSVQHFGVIEVQDSIRYIDSLPEPMAQMKYTVLLPMGDDENADFLQSVITNNLKCSKDDSGNIYRCLLSKQQTFFDQYKDNAADIDKEYTLSSMNNWAIDDGFSVVYNENNIVVLDNYHYEYTGGAHGNYSSSFINIDMANKKVLSIHDIIKIDSAALIQKLEIQARLHFGLDEQQGLNSRLFNNELHIPDNFYIGAKGITFVYGLYEIASYADGIIELYIPYNKLSDMLTPSFKERMQLEQVALN